MANIVKAHTTSGLVIDDTPNTKDVHRDRRTPPITNAANASKKFTKLRSVWESAKHEESNLFFHLFSWTGHLGLAIEGLRKDIRRSSNNAARSQSESLIKEVIMTIV